MDSGRLKILSAAVALSTFLSVGCASSGAPRWLEARGQARSLLAQVENAPDRPNELWSWDITKLLGPAKWTYFYLYVMLDGVDHRDALVPRVQIHAH
jgi:putative transposase